MIIPAYNAAATLERAVRSAQAQPQAHEIVVVDDGSRDGTAELARALDDGSGRLRVLSQANAGPSAARNLAISATRSTWICPLDADDFMLPGRLGRLIAHGQDSDFVADDILAAQEGAEAEPPMRLIGDRLLLPFFLDFHTIVDANVTRPGLARREFGFLKPLIRRAFLERSGLGYDARLRLGEDFILYANALARGARFKVVEACGYVSVQRPNSLSHQHTPADLRALRIVNAELATLPSLTPRELAAVQRHHRHLTAKIDHREVLEAKRTGGMLGALAMMALRAPSALYILRQRLGSANARGEGPPRSRSASRCRPVGPR